MHKSKDVQMISTSRQIQPPIKIFYFVLTTHIGQDKGNKIC